VVLNREPETIYVEWAPADTPLAPIYPYRKTCYVRLYEGEGQHAGRRRLHNLGFGKRRTLRRNVEDFQRHFEYSAITGELDDIEDALRLYHDAGCMPAVSDAELDERILRPIVSTGSYTPACSPGKPAPRKAPVPPPGPPPSFGHPRVGGGMPVGRAACAPWLQPRPLLPVQLKLINWDRTPWPQRRYQVTTDDGVLGPFETDGSGGASFEIPADTNCFEVTLWPNDSRHPQHETLQWRFHVRPLPPSSTVAGATTRLRHLDFWSGGVLDEWSADARAALRAFQAAHGIPTTGTLDQLTCALLDRASVEPQT
jgi:hypothetical protein